MSSIWGDTLLKKLSEQVVPALEQRIAQLEEQVRALTEAAERPRPAELSRKQARG